MPTDTEIFVEEFSYPLDFPASRTAKKWQIAYYPLDRGIDSALYMLKYRPDPVNNPMNYDSYRLKY